MKLIKKLFGGVKLTWPRLIIFAVAAGVWSALVCIIPIFKYTSFHTIAESFEVWILFGIFIIMNSGSNKDSALKCFVFFLISQPLVYLLQVPFSWQGWALFRYYPYWAVWTVLCLPMGYIGYYMKKGSWLGFLILSPMIILTAFSYYTYFSSFQFYFPFFILIILFCAVAAIGYAPAIFEDKKIKLAGAILGGVLIVGATVVCLLNPPAYTPYFLGNSEEHPLGAGYTAYLADDSIGSVSVEYVDNLGDYMLRGDFRHSGTTTLTVVAPNGEKTVYDLTVKQTTYDITKR